MSEFEVRYRSKALKLKEKQSPANEYPAGAVPEETGWFDQEHSLSKPAGHNRITVCRGRRTVSRKA